MESKIKIVQRVLKEYEMLLLDNPQEVYDVLGFNMSFNLGEYDASILIGKKTSFVVCDSLLYPYMSNLKNVKIVKADSYEYLKNNRLFLHEWKKILKENKITKLALANMSLEYAFREFSTFHFLSPVRTLGKIKQKSEITDIKNLAKIMNRLFLSAEEYLEEGMTDVKLRNLVDEKIYSLGCDRRYLPTYVGFDSKSIYPTLSAEHLKRGDLVLLDAGIMKNGTGLSFSKTFIYGKSSAKKEKMHQIVKDGLEVILSKVKSSFSPSEADASYREFLSNHKLLDKSLEYSVSFIASAQSGEINSITDKNKFMDGQIVKATSSVFLPQMYGARVESIVLIKGKSYETIL